MVSMFEKLWERMSFVQSTTTVEMAEFSEASTIMHDFDKQRAAVLSLITCWGVG